MKFAGFGLHKQLLANITAKGYTRATDIQYKAIPHILDREDVMAIAQTGTGKTAAYVIPVVQQLTNQRRTKEKSIKCLVLVPTRELALQITEQFKSLAHNLNLGIACIYGGVEQEAQIRKITEGADIVIATPGRMFDLVYQKIVNLSMLQILVLDEADQMLDLGFQDDISHLLRLIPRFRQTLFFSATINEKIKKLAYAMVTKAIRIELSPKDPISKNIDHYVMFVGMDDKRFFLERLVHEHQDEKIMVFVRTQVRADRVVKAMERVDISAVAIHGGMDQKERTASLQAFKDGEVKLLIATDVSARGIDVAQVNYVVNYDLPDKAEQYVHRIGRTGRGEHKGHAVSFCSDEEREYLLAIEALISKPVEVLKVDNLEYESTIDFSIDNKKSSDWKGLIADLDKQLEGGWRKVKKKKS